MNYPKLASDILKNVGGETNVVNVTHCATRLRFNLKATSKANVYNEILKLGEFPKGATTDNGKKPYK